MSDRPLHLAMIAGEPSGDQQGAALLQALRSHAAPRPVEAWGIGGSRMRAAGVALRYNSEPWATIGLVEALSHLPFLIRVLADMKSALAANPPDVLVLIDSGAVNVRLARWAKRQRLCPVFYYFPPGSWRRSAGRAMPPAGRGPGDRLRRLLRPSLAEVTDLIVTPFSWSAERLRHEGADARWVGHPLLDLVVPTLRDAQFYERFGLDPHRPLVALLPGSRQQEIRHILPPLIGAAGEVTRRIPGVQFALALAASAPRALVEEIVRREQRRGGRAGRLPLLMHQAGGRLAQIAHNTLIPPSPLLATNEGLALPLQEDQDLPAGRERPGRGQAPLVICEGLSYDVLARSDLVITKSGTSTLEAAILHKPMIVVYRGSALMGLEWRLRKRSMNIAHIALPNILAGERLCPELLQEEASPEAIAELAVEMLLQPERMLPLKERLADVIRTHLGEPGGVERAAALLYALVPPPAASP